ncbi:MAG: plasmid mobilization relaxosome protein MobC [Bacteroidota bacterium]
MIRSRAARAGMTMSEYIRQMSLYGEVTIRQSKYDHAFVEQLRRIGVNLNQQTKALNSTGVVRPELPVLWGKLETLIDHILENMH